MAERLILFAIVFGTMLVEARRASANERAQRARGGIEPAGDVYAIMRVVYPGAFLAMFVEGALRAQRRRRPLVLAGAAALRRRQGAEMVGDPLARPVLDVSRHRRSRARAWSPAGPYRWLRHPNYVGVMGELAGVALMTGALVSGVAGIATFGWLLVRRIAVEERALREAAR